MTFIDHKYQAVFNGSDLGRQYSAKAIQERCMIKPEIVQQEQPLLSQKFKAPIKNNGESIRDISSSEKDDGIFDKHQRFELLEKLLLHEYKQGNLPDELTEELRLKRKKKKRLHL
jgi:hypothetical protein